METKNNNCWFTSETMVMMDEIIKEKWFVREVIYPKDVIGCEIFEYNGCKRLYHGKDRFFAMEGEKLNTETGKYCNLNVDFSSAEKIVIQKRDDAAFDHWQSDLFELTSLWKDRQLVIAINHKTDQLIAFAPIFVVNTPKFHTTPDMKNFHEFEHEFLHYWHNLEKSYAKTIPAETSAFFKNSYNLLLWLKSHCY
jgi:hypothetical protein